MSREIKFRGKRVDNGEWVYGDLLQTKPKHGCERVIIPSGCFCVNGFESVVMEMPIIEWGTLGQFTGLKDKNGAEIYEGDVVKSMHFLPSIVNQRYCCWHAWDTPLHPLVDSVYEDNEWEIIGNIHDNPKLIA